MCGLVVMAQLLWTFTSSFDECRTVPSGCWPSDQTAVNPQLKPTTFIHEISYLLLLSALTIAIYFLKIGSKSDNYFTIWPRVESRVDLGIAVRCAAQARGSLSKGRRLSQPRYCSNMCSPGPGLFMTGWKAVSLGTYDRVEGWVSLGTAVRCAAQARGCLSRWF